MDVQLRVIHSADFLLSSPTGELDIEQSKQIMRTLAAANKPPNDRDILIDVRGARAAAIELSQVIELVKVMVDHLPAFQNKLALLIARDAPRERAALMKRLADDRGFKMDVFDDYEQAINWLTSSIPVVPPKTDA